MTTAAEPLVRRDPDPLVRRDRDTRGVAILTLNRPQAFNALSEAMLAAMQRELDAIANDEAVRVVVLAAEGRAFCAGHDLKEMARHRADGSKMRPCFGRLWGTMARENSWFTKRDA